MTTTAGGGIWMNRSDRRLLAKKGKLEQFAGEISRAGNRTRRPNRPKPPQPEPPQGGTREIAESERERLRPPQGGAENRGKEDKA